MKRDIAIKISELKELTTYHYKVILYLDGIGKATQSQMSERLECTKQRINVVCKELKTMNIIRVNCKEGRNIFWELNPNPEFQIKGQIKLENL